MICVQFVFKPGTYDDDFHHLDGQIDAYARTLPGFIRTETWHQPRTRPGQRDVLLHRQKALAHLAKYPIHTEAKGQVHRWYDGYRIVVTEVKASYGDGRLPQ